MAPSPTNKKIANSLVSLSSAAILVVYAAGFMKTRAAAQRIEESSNNRRPMMPAPATAGEMTTPPPIEPPAPVAKPSAVPPAAAIKKLPKPKSPAVVVPKSTNTSPLPTPAPLPAPAVISTAATAPVMKAEPTPTPVLKWPEEPYIDGTFLGWGTSRHGDIQASITIKGGRFVAASIAQCLTRYSCSWVEKLPGQVVSRQSPNVDYVSGATESANAFYWAIVDALKKAK